MSYWYYRENATDELVGPMEFDHAVAGARYLSKLKDRSGFGEVVSILGTRPGDSVNTPQRPAVERLYIRGRLVAMGRVAQVYSDTGRVPGDLTPGSFFA